jgi:dTDP-4-dehydrorhamnose 3,5-epimerase
MDVILTELPGVVTATTTRFRDSRGSFGRLFCDIELRPFLQGAAIRQINHSLTRNVGAIRGLHFQYPPHCERKLVRCLHGAIWDIVVDLRADSPTLFHCHAEELSPENGKMIIIPEGYAHGFQVLKPDTEVLYLHTYPYTPGSEGGIRYYDPRLGIEWPITVTDVSHRDCEHPLLDDTFKGLKL